MTVKRPFGRVLTGRTVVHVPPLTCCSSRTLLSPRTKPLSFTRPVRQRPLERRVEVEHADREPRRAEVERTPEVLREHRPGRADALQPDGDGPAGRPAGDDEVAEARQPEPLRQLRPGQQERPPAVVLRERVVRIRDRRRGTAPASPSATPRRPRPSVRPRSSGRRSSRRGRSRRAPCPRWRRSHGSSSPTPPGCRRRPGCACRRRDRRACPASASRGRTSARRRPARGEPADASRPASPRARRRAGSGRAAACSRRSAWRRGGGRAGRRGRPFRRAGAARRRRRTAAANAAERSLLAATRCVPGFSFRTLPRASTTLKGFEELTTTAAFPSASSTRTGRAGTSCSFVPR